MYADAERTATDTAKPALKTHVATSAGPYASPSGASYSPPAHVQDTSEHDSDDSDDMDNDFYKIVNEDIDVR